MPVARFLLQFQLRFHSIFARIEVWSVKTTLDFAVILRVRNLKASPVPQPKHKGRTMKAFIVSFLHDESGATAIEYGLIAAGIAIAIIAAVNGVGTALSTTFTSISTSLK